jgi:hypothetical protein
MKATSNHLSAYLNDHLAGSVAIVNLLEHLKQTEAGKGVERFLVELRGDVVADQLTLEAVMRRAQIKKHLLRTATARMVGAVGRLKLRFDDTGDGTLLLLEAFEMVEVGIEGKRSLWQALAATAELTPLLQGINFDHLIKRAEDQHRRVEVIRVETARTALVAA